MSFKRNKKAKKETKAEEKKLDCKLMLMNLRSLNLPHTYKTGQ